MGTHDMTSSLKTCEEVNGSKMRKQNQGNKMAKKCIGLQYKGRGQRIEYMPLFDSRSNHWAYPSLAPQSVEGSLSCRISKLVRWSEGIIGFLEQFYTPSLLPYSSVRGTANHRSEELFRVWKNRRPYTNQPVVTTDEVRESGTVEIEVEPHASKS
jgi:hypothetical protein